jgi:plasmid stability protein
MASLTLKNLPDELLRALRKAAAKDRRSVTQEIIHLLESALGGRAERPAPRSRDSDAQLAAWRKLAVKWESDVDRATEAERLVKHRTSGREVDF